MNLNHILSGVEDDVLALSRPVREWTREELARWVSVAQAARPPRRAGVITFIDSALQRVPGDGGVDATWHYPAHGLPTYVGGQIRHCWAKSFQEFAVKKWRGDHLTLEGNPYERGFPIFFEWNGRSTPERFGPPDDAFVRRIEEDMERLRSLPGVAASDRALRDSFLDLLAPMGGDRELRRVCAKASSEALGPPRKGHAWRVWLLIAAVAVAVLLLVLTGVLRGWSVSRTRWRGGGSTRRRAGCRRRTRAGSRRRCGRGANG